MTHRTTGRIDTGDVSGSGPINTSQPPTTDWPDVVVVIPTRNRPVLLGQAVDAVLKQDYPGRLDVVIVMDQSDADMALGALQASDRVRVLDNTRVPGLAGARNTGILAGNGDLVAFCDDDDVWLPGKLRRQVGALMASPAAAFATCAIEVEYENRLTPRLAGRDLITHSDLIPRRMSMLHSSTFLARRSALTGSVGLIDEHIPGSHNEDWDLLLRATADHPIVHVDEALVKVRWSAESFFSQDWERKVSSLQWMLERHPEIARSRIGAARVYGQIAFAKAVSGQRRDAARWIYRSLHRSWREVRAYLALCVIAGVSGDLILRQLHRHGRGI